MIVTLHYNSKKYQDYSESGSNFIQDSEGNYVPNYKTVMRPISSRTIMHRIGRTQNTSDVTYDADGSYSLRRSLSRSSTSSFTTDNEEIAAIIPSPRRNVKGLQGQSDISRNPINGSVPFKSREISSIALGNSTGMTGLSETCSGSLQKKFLKYVPKSIEDSLASISSYKHRYYEGDTPLEILEEEWWHDLKSVSSRLHLLKESYKAIQQIKQRKLSNKFDVKIDLQIASDGDRVLPSSFPIQGSDDEILTSSQIHDPSQDDDNEVSGNNNTDAPIPSSRNIIRRAVPL